MARGASTCTHRRYQVATKRRAKQAEEKAHRGEILVRIAIGTARVDWRVSWVQEVDDGSPPKKGPATGPVLIAG